MELRVAGEADQAEWDAFVSSAACGHFMQSFAWGTLQRRSGWDPSYLLWRDDGGIRAAALLLARRVPPLGKKLFYAPRGPVLDFGDPAAVSAVEADLASYVARERGVLLRVDPYVSDPAAGGGSVLPAATRVARDWSYWNAPKLVLWLDLRKDEDALFRGMSSTCRNEVRKGYRNGVEFTAGSVEDLAGFHRLMTLTGQHKGIAVHDLDYYHRLFSVVGRSAALQLFLGRFHDEAVTAGVSLRYGRKAWLLYAASSPDSYRLRANRTLQWEMIKWAHAAGCERYDFRGTACSDPPSPSDPGYGVYEFKKSFGPDYVRLAGYFDYVARPGLYRVLRLAEERLLPAAYRVRTWLPARRARE